MEIKTVKQVKMKDVIDHFLLKGEKWLSEFLNGVADSSANDGEQLYTFENRKDLVFNIYENLDHIEDDKDANNETERLVKLLEKEIPDLFEVQFVCW